MELSFYLFAVFNSAKRVFDLRWNFEIIKKISFTFLQHIYNVFSLHFYSTWNLFWNVFLNFTGQGSLTRNPPVENKTYLKSFPSLRSRFSLRYSQDSFNKTVANIIIGVNFSFYNQIFLYPSLTNCFFVPNILICIFLAKGNWQKSYS